MNGFGMQCTMRERLSRVVSYKKTKTTMKTANIHVGYVLCQKMRTIKTAYDNKESSGKEYNN